MWAERQTTFTHEEDRYNIKWPLHLFLKDKNIQALMEVLMDDTEYGTHGAVTRWNVISWYAKNNPDIQQELTDILKDLDVAQLTPDELDKVLSFAHWSLDEEIVQKEEKRQLEETDKYLPLLYKKRAQDYRAGKFDQMDIRTQANILQNISSAKLFSEEEVESRTVLKGAYPRTRAELLFDYNPYKAIDFIASLHQGEALASFVIIESLDNNKGTFAKHIEYVLNNYDNIISRKDKQELKEYLEYLQNEIQKKTVE